MSAALKAIHVKRRGLGLDDDDYRDTLERVTGKRSAADLSEKQRLAVVAELDRMGAPRAQRKTDLAGRYAPVLRALWLTGWNLGVINDPHDSALIAFVERQTGISHTRWLREQADARRAIEGLKKWVEREGRISLKDASAQARKMAVVEAQLERLGMAAPFDLLAASGEELDALAARLGRRIRETREGRDEQA